MQNKLWILRFPLCSLLFKMNIAHLTFVILLQQFPGCLLFLPLFEIYWLPELLQLMLSEMCDSGNAFVLALDMKSLHRDHHAMDYHLQVCYLSGAS